MSSAKITLLGFYNWMDADGQDLFTEFSGLPSGVDTDTLKQNILLRGGEFEVIYSDPVFFQAAVRPWVKKWYRTIDKWIEALAIKYDPLFNYDRTEEWTDTGETGKATIDKIERSTADDMGRSLNTITESNSTIGEDHSGSVTTTNEVSAFDSTSYQAHDKSTATDTTGIDTTTDSTVNTGTSENERREISENEDRAGSENATSESTHKGRMFGNIGVTTSQQMLRDELEVDRFNLIDEITDLFLTEFVIPVYV